MVHYINKSDQDMIYVFDSKKNVIIFPRMEHDLPAVINFQNANHGFEILHLPKNLHYDKTTFYIVSLDVLMAAHKHQYIYTDQLVAPSKESKTMCFPYNQKRQAHHGFVSGKDMVSSKLFNPAFQI